MKTTTTTPGQSAFPITALRAVRGLAHRAGITLLALVVAFCALSADRAHGQASITSPSTSEALPLPTFTLRWNNGQGQIFILKIAVDDRYMFTVDQRVANMSGVPIVARPYAVVNRAETATSQLELTRDYFNHLHDLAR